MVGHLSQPRKFPNIIDSSELYLDFRHDKSGNAIGVFQVTNNAIEYYVISDANKIARLSNVFRSKTLQGERFAKKEKNYILK